MQQKLGNGRRRVWHDAWLRPPRFAEIAEEFANLSLKFFSQMPRKSVESKLTPPIFRPAHTGGQRLWQWNAVSGISRRRGCVVAQGKPPPGPVTKCGARSAPTIRAPRSDKPLNQQSESSATGAKEQ